jgi:competence protein ComEC
MSRMTRLIIITLLVAGNIFVWHAAFPRSELTVSFLDVGQGDAVLLTSPTGVQLLIDGGPDTSVLRELGKELALFDRFIDVIVATHPDEDHIAGLVHVLSRYDVGAYLESGVLNDTTTTHALNAAVVNEGLTPILARRGMRLSLGGGVYADILFPDRDVSNLETNTGSVVMRVVYGETAFMLTGDSPQSIEKYLLSLNQNCAIPGNSTSEECELGADVLKAGHHGSKTSSNEEFVKVVSPTYVIYSRGCDNRYGHPAPEVVSLFEKREVISLDTCKNGTVTFRSDGRVFLP